MTVYKFFNPRHDPKTGRFARREGGPVTTQRPVRSKRSRIAKESVGKRSKKNKKADTLVKKALMTTGAAIIGWEGWKAVRKVNPWDHPLDPPVPKNAPRGTLFGLDHDIQLTGLDPTPHPGFAEHVRKITNAIPRDHLKNLGSISYGTRENSRNYQIAHPDRLFKEPVPADDGTPLGSVLVDLEKRRRQRIVDGETDGIRMAMRGSLGMTAPSGLYAHPVADIYIRTDVSGRERANLNLPGILNPFGRTRLAGSNMYHTVVHELGHHVHMGLMDEKLSKRVTQMYKDREKGGKFISLYAASDEREFFAESYLTYITKPRYLKARDPQMHDFLRQEVFKGITYDT